MVEETGKVSLIQGYLPHIPNVKPLPYGEKWILIADFQYTDENGVTSRAEGTEEHPFEFDFTSIPKFAWSIVGGPATGKYRYAAIIHDWDCRQRKETWQIVHKRFLSGMKFSKVSWVKRSTMYGLVHRFGPRW